MLSESFGYDVKKEKYGKDSKFPIFTIVISVGDLW